MTTQGGFSLIEMLVVIAIVGILAAVGVPAYGNYVTQGRVTDATAELAAKRNQMEQYYQDRLTYCGTDCNVGIAGCINDTTSSDFFNFACRDGSKSTYTIVATGKAAMTGFEFTLNHKNQRTTTISDPAPQNWRTTVKQCWITKAGAAC